MLDIPERNLRGVDLNLLVVFDALMAERHVTRAAQHNGLSQPAMSKALNRLRHLFNDRLFDRRDGRRRPEKVGPRRHGGHGDSPCSPCLRGEAFLALRRHGDSPVRNWVPFVAAKGRAGGWRRGKFLPLRLDCFGQAASQ
jgi:hypothetical protein